MIGAILGQRLENVGDIDDARFERQRIAGDMKRVALAIGGFMMVRGPARDVLDGVEALEAARERPFDVILMDIRMPRMDGIEATRAIRLLPGAAGRTPILALTANADPTDMQNYIDAGMQGAVEKPVKAEKLAMALDSVLSGPALIEAAG